LNSSSSQDVSGFRAATLRLVGAIDTFDLRWFRPQAANLELSLSPVFRGLRGSQAGIAVSPSKKYQWEPETDASQRHSVLIDAQTS